MPVYQIKKDGKLYEVKAPDQASAIKALGNFQPKAATPPAAAPTGQLARTDLPPDIRAELERTMTQPDSGDVLLQNIEHLLPTAGGAVGGMIGSAAGPAGAIGGATLGASAGEAYRQLMRRARGASAPATPVGAAKDIAVQGAVSGAVPEAVGQVGGKVLAATGKRLMRSAVKPTMNLIRRGKADQVVQTLLDEGVNVTPNGVRKLQGLLGATNDEITDAVATSGAKINPFKVTSRLSDTAKTFANQVNPSADLRTIGRVGNEFLSHPALEEGALSAPAAQALKQGTYKQIGKSYGKLSNAAVESQKALARGLKEELAAEIPQIHGLNVREGKLLEALDATGRRVALAGNRDPVGFAWVTHNPMTFLAAIMDRSPAVKSFLARGSYQTAGKFAKVSPDLIRAAMVALTSENADASSAQTGAPNDRNPTGPASR